jgi:membrane-associated phospholipid phosphatase
MSETPVPSTSADPRDGGSLVSSVVRAVDVGADRFFDGLRDDPRVGLWASTTSNLADYGFVWAVIALAKGRHGGSARRRALRALAVAGVTSYSVNLVVKRLVGRARPEQDEPAAPGVSGAMPVRAPTSSSFPSGHTLAASCTAIVFADSAPQLLLFGGFAGSVAASRVYLRAHHASDVIGGVVIGAASGILARKVLGPRPLPKGTS